MYSYVTEDEQGHAFETFYCGNIYQMFSMMIHYLFTAYQTIKIEHKI